MLSVTIAGSVPASCEVACTVTSPNIGPRLD
jgi:hypothetical protein